MSQYVQEIRDFLRAVDAMIQNDKRREAAPVVKLAQPISWDEFYDKKRKRKLDFEFQRMQEIAAQKEKAKLAQNIRL